MRRIQVKQLSYDLTPVAGLALAGHYLGALDASWRRLDASLPVRSGVPSSDIVRSYLGLLVQGKSDFDAVEGFRGDAFFKQALGVKLLPSSPTLRQRLDAKAGAMFDHVPPMIETLLAGQRPDYGVLPCGWLPLDIDTFAMDNGGTAKEGVGRTYAGVDGYCPLAAYLGERGSCLEPALRPGVQHSALETEFNVGRLVPMARRLSAAGAEGAAAAAAGRGVRLGQAHARHRRVQHAGSAGGGLARQVEPARHRRGRRGAAARCRAGRAVAAAASGQARGAVGGNPAHRRHRPAAAAHPAADRAQHRPARPDSAGATARTRGLEH
jgi:hypothetical protein